MRGTGCSGGAFDFFEPLQNLDGYDVIETVARQPWVRARQGRDGRRVLRRDQPAVRRPDAAAEPGRDHAAVGDRQHADDALSGRHPQHRLHARVGEGPRPRRRCPRRSRRPGVGAQAHPGGRQDLQGQPGAARRGDRPDRQGPPQRPLRAEGRRPAVARPLRAEDQRAGLPRLPVHRRADRRALPVAAAALHRHEAQVVHVRQRRPHRLARPGHVRALVRLPRALRRARRPQLPQGVRDAAPLDPQGAHGRRGRRPARRPDPGAAELRRRARRVRGAAVGADPVRQRRRRGAVPARPRLRALVLALPAAGHGGALVVPRGRRERSPT